MDSTLGWNIPTVMTKTLCVIYLVGSCIAATLFGISAYIACFAAVTLACLLCLESTSPSPVKSMAGNTPAGEPKKFDCKDAHCPCETHYSPMIYIEGEYEYGNGVWQPAYCKKDECPCSYHLRPGVFFNSDHWATDDGSLWSGYCYDQYCFCNQHTQSRRFDITEKQWLFRLACTEEYCPCWWHRTSGQKFDEGQWQRR